MKKVIVYPDRSFVNIFYDAYPHLPVHVEDGGFVTSQVARCERVHDPLTCVVLLQSKMVHITRPCDLNNLHTGKAST